MWHLCRHLVRRQWTSQLSSAAWFSRFTQQNLSAYQLFSQETVQLSQRYSAICGYSPIHRRSCQCRGLASPALASRIDEQAKIILLPERDITIADLASRLPDVTVEDIQVILSELEHEVDSIESCIPSEVAEFVVVEAGHIPQIEVKQPWHRMSEEQRASLPRRPPVVTIMGHVDHGKTTLLDYLRKTSVAAGEAGGITQHIGAFSVTLPGKKDTITFLDTPGHAAFTAMRSRGTQATDVVVLVVAADDGVMAQTIECIELAQQAGVPIVVAINKCDLPHADIGRAKIGLLQNNVQLEEFGGDVVAVEISGLQGTNMTELQEAILLTAELADCRGDETAVSRGVILETKTRPGLGPVASALVMQGTLKPSSTVVAGSVCGRVRQLFDHMDKPVRAALPSTPVQIVGWKSLPQAGDVFQQVSCETEADALQKAHMEKARAAAARAGRQTMAERRARVKELVSQLQERRKAVEDKYKDQLEKHRHLEKAYRHELFKAAQISNEDRFGVMGVAKDAGHCLSVVLKGDVQGSVDALRHCIAKYCDPLVRLKVVHQSIGEVSEHDIDVACSFQAMVFGLNVRCSSRSEKVARQNNVKIVTHRIIYKLVDLMKTEMEKKIPVLIQKELKGKVEIREVFKLTGRRAAIVAGCFVLDGELARSDKVCVRRKREIVYEGKLQTLNQGKKTVASVNKESECGVTFEDESFEFCVGDIIEVIKEKEIRQAVRWVL